MTPLDNSSRRALIVGHQPLELFDLSDYLTVSGWPVAHTASDAATATMMLSATERGYGLVIVALPHGDPATVSMLRQAQASGAGVISINGAISTVRDTRIVPIERPYMDGDLTVALRALGFADA